MLDKTKTYLFTDANQCQAFVKEVEACGQSIYSGSWIYSPPKTLGKPYCGYMFYSDASRRWCGGPTPFGLSEPAVHYVVERVTPW